MTPLCIAAYFYAWILAGIAFGWGMWRNRMSPKEWREGMIGLWKIARSKEFWSLEWLPKFIESHIPKQ